MENESQSLEKTKSTGMYPKMKKENLVSWKLTDTFIVVVDETGRSSDLLRTSPDPFRIVDCSSDDPMQISAK
jgi:hypothetical protein